MILFAISLLCTGGFVAVFSGVWTLAIALQRQPAGEFALGSARWREVRAPFLLGVGSVSLMAVAVCAMPRELFAPLRAVTASFPFAQTQEQALAAEQQMVAARRNSDLQMRLIDLQAQESTLRGRRAQIDPADFPGALALSAEIKQFNAELQQVLNELHAKGLAVQ